MSSELAAQLAVAYRLHERSTDFEWGNDRDVAYAAFILQFLADPTNEGTAEALKTISRRRMAARRQMKGTPRVFATTNSRRTLAAAARVAAEVARVLADPKSDGNCDEIRAAELRRDHPTLSLRQLAELAGWTKDKYAAHLSRYLHRNRKRGIGVAA